jgi:hypothetical protein
LAVTYGVYRHYYAPPDMDHSDQRSFARGAEERTVRDYVLDNAHDPKSVEFDRWGPHDLAGDLGLTEQLQAGTAPGEQVVRVRYRASNPSGAKQLHDELFVVRKGKAVGRFSNDAGDEWKDRWQKSLAATKPATPAPSPPPAPSPATTPTPIPPAGGPATPMPMAPPTPVAPAPPAKPPGAPPVDPAVKALADKVTTGAGDEKIAAAAALAKLGSSAVAACQPLVVMAMSEDETTQQSELDALEKIHPDLHKHILVLLVEGEYRKHVAASKAIGAMGDRGRPAVPLLLARLKLLLTEPPRRIVSRSERLHGAYYYGMAGLGTGEKYMYSADMEALLRLASDDDQFAALLTQIAKSPRWGDPTAYRSVPTDVIDAVAKVGQAHAAKRPPMVATLVEMLSAERPDVRVIDYLKKFGKDAVAAGPVLKKLRLHPDDRTRSAARDALAEIEKP